MSAARGTARTQRPQRNTTSQFGGSAKPYADWGNGFGGYVEMNDDQVGMWPTEPAGARTRGVLHGRDSY